MNVGTVAHSLKGLIIVVCFLLANNTFAKSLQCSSKNDTSKKFLLHIENESLWIEDDGFFNRGEVECASKYLTGCIFNFQMNSDKPFMVTDNNGYEISAEQQWWFSAKLTFRFDQQLDESSGPVGLVLKGYDGQSTKLRSDFLACEPQ